MPQDPLSPAVSRRTAAAVAGAALLVGLAAGAGLGALRDEPGASPARTVTVAATPAPFSGPPVVPEGWTRYTSSDGSTFALPPEWKLEGIASGERWVSVSGASSVQVLAVPGADPAATTAEVTGQAGYDEIEARDTTFRGAPARVLDYAVRDADSAERASDLAVSVGGTGYLLHVESREELWPTLEPLVDAVRGTFVPGG